MYNNCPKLSMWKVHTHGTGILGRWLLCAFIQDSGRKLNTAKFLVFYEVYYFSSLLATAMYVWPTVSVDAQ